MPRYEVRVVVPFETNDEWHQINNALVAFDAWKVAAGTGFGKRDIEYQPNDLMPLERLLDGLYEALAATNLRDWFVDCYLVDDYDDEDDE